MKFLLNKGDKNNNIDDVILDVVDKNKIILFKLVNDKISRKKKEIDDEEIQKYWDKMKKIGNPYELIYTSYNKKRKNDSISSYSPISRSYFKLWEIFYNFDLFKNKSKDLNFVHLAGGPGGFMEASINYSNLKNFKNCCYYGITLKPNDEYVPDWNKLKKSFKKENNCFIEYGDLYVYEDVVKFLKKINKKCDIVTADGGFDYSEDFNGQELNSSRIIYSEIAVALNALNKNGNFIIKLFDLFSLNSVHYMHLLNHSFENVTIFKPETSRPANSEKYIICTNFLDNLSNNYKKKLIENIKIWSSFDVQNKHVIFKNFKVDNNIVHNLSDFNNKYVDFQIDSINFIINIIKNKLSKNEYHNTLKDQVFKAIEWCEKYNVPVNENSIYYKKNN